MSRSAFTQEGNAMAWFKSARHGASAGPRAAAPLSLERLESRTLLDATASLLAGTLTVTGGATDDRISLFLDAQRNQIVVSDGGNGIIGRFDNAAVGLINVDAGAGNDVVRIDNNIFQTATILGGPGNDVLYG